jgi:toxin ParE1/3/4
MPLAKRDLRGIWRYIKRENSELVADLVVSRIYGVFDVLAAAPRIGRVRKDLPGEPRSFPVRPYAIFYVPKTERAGILVWRVLHGARDLQLIVKRPKDMP